MQQKLIHFFLTIIVLGYIIFEELVWERFAQPIIRFITRLKIAQKLKKHLQTINSKIILVIFLLLFATVELQGIYAANLFFHGKLLTGLFVYAGKIPISAFTFWLFKATKSKLMEFSLFKSAYDYVMGWVDKITHSQIYLDIKTKTAPIKQYLRKLLSSDKSELKERVTNIYRKLRIVVKRKINLFEKSNK